jgi:hypothetical protein
LAACRGCGQKAQQPDGLERLLPRDAQAIVFVPRLGAAVERLGQLAQSLSQIPEGELLGQALDELARQLSGGGKPEALPEALGLDRARAMAVVMVKADAVAPQLWLALPVKDRAVFESRLAKLTASRFGAHDESDGQGGRHYVGADGSVVAAFRFDDRVGGTALVSVGPRATALVNSAADLKREASLAGSPDYQAARSRWSDMDLWVFVPEGADLRLGSFAFKPSRGSGVGMTFGKEGVRARGVALLTIAQTTAAGSLAVPGDTEALAGLLSTEAPLTLKLGIDPSALAGSPALAQVLPEGLSEAIQAAGLKLDDLMRSVGPGLVLSLALSDAPSFRVMPSLDPREANPFGFVTLRAACRVRNVDNMRAALAKIEAAGPSYGVAYRPSSLSGVAVQTASYSQGESVSLALADHTLLVTGGAGEMAKALAAVAAPAQPPASRSKAVASLRLDVPRLLTQIDAVPAAAFGGFAGLTVRSLVSRLASPMAHFGPVEASLNLEGDAAIADLRVPLR